MTRSQSSTSQGLSSSGIFTFTSTRLANISSWTHRIREQLKKRQNGIISVHPAGLHRSNMFEMIIIVITNLFALVAHMNWKQQPGRGMVSPERKENQRNKQQKHAAPGFATRWRAQTTMPALTNAYGLS